MLNADDLLGKDGIFADRLRKLYYATDQTQEEVGKAIGVTRQTFSKYLEGKAKPTIENIFNLAKHFGVSADYLLGLQEIKSPDMDIQKIHDITGLSEEVISSLQREIKIIKRLTNKKDVDLALSEFIALRKINLNICDSPRGEFAEYLEDNGIAGINEILDYDLKITPIDLIKVLPDAIVCNELMRGAFSKYTNKNFNAVMIDLYEVLSHRPQKTVYKLYEETNYDDIDIDNIDIDNFEERELTDDNFLDYCEINNKRIAKYGTEPLISQEALGVSEKNELEDEDIFAIKVLKLQQALNRRLDDLKIQKE